MIDITPLNGIAQDATSDLTGITEEELVKAIKDSAKTGVSQFNASKGTNNRYEYLTNYIFDNRW